nr:hypothetical protein [Mycobacterium avium]
MDTADVAGATGLVGAIGAIAGAADTTGGCAPIPAGCGMAAGAGALAGAANPANPARPASPASPPRLVMDRLKPTCSSSGNSWRMNRSVRMVQLMIR